MLAFFLLKIHSQLLLTISRTFPVLITSICILLRELIIIQSSPFTKDYRDIYKTIQTFQDSRISVKIASLVGWTFVYQKLVETCRGSYVTIGSQK